MSIRGAFRELFAASYPPPVPPATAPAIASPWSDASALETATWIGLLDQLDSLPPTRNQAMALGAVARGRDLIAVSVARFPLWAMNRDGRTASQPWIVAQPEAGRARFTTLVWTIDSLIFFGVAWWLVVDRDSERRPRRVRWVPPSFAETDEAGNIRTAFGREVNPVTDVIRFDAPHEGFLSRGREAVRNARRLAASYATNTASAIPQIELHQTAGDALTDPEIDALTQRWAAARRGENGGVAFTNQSIETKPHGQQPENLLIAGRNSADLDLVRHLGLPAWAADVQIEGSSLTYSNVPSRSRELIDYTLSGYMEAIASRLSLDDILPRGTWAAFNTDVLTDGDFGERMTAAKAAVDAGIFTAEEMRAREDGVPLELVDTSTEVAL